MPQLMTGKESEVLFASVLRGAYQPGEQRKFPAISSLTGDRLLILCTGHIMGGSSRRGRSGRQTAQLNKHDRQPHRVHDNAGIAPVYSCSYIIHNKRKFGSKNAGRAPTDSRFH